MIKNIRITICYIGSVRKGLLCFSQVAFNVTVELDSCLDAPHRFSLRPVGFQDTLEVELESLCVCDCQRSIELNSTHCSEGQGALECGSCICNRGFIGPRCECAEDKGQVSDCR